MDLTEAIKNRRSVREFLTTKVEEETIADILEAGRWAPSGLNNQPWRFKVVKDDKTKKQLSEQTSYKETIESAPVCIAVYIDSESVYDRTKDLQAIGSCIQNMLLRIHSLGLGGCWLGEILKNRDKVNNILKIPNRYEFMAVIALGYPRKTEPRPERKKASELML